MNLYCNVKRGRNIESRHEVYALAIDEGEKIKINQNNFVVEKAVPRCLAINCNPDTGERDHNLLKSMLQIQAARPPEFAIRLIPQELKGVINIGDEVKVIKS